MDPLVDYFMDWPSKEMLAGPNFLQNFEELAFNASTLSTLRELFLNVGREF